MKLATFTAPALERPRAGVVRDDRGRRARGRPARGRRARGPAAAAREGVLGARRPDAARARARSPGTIYAIGLNYAKHIEETGGHKPDAPIVFVKVRGSVAPPGGPIVCPEVVRRLDYEGELTIVMGAGGQIAGYCIADDVTARDLQGREPQWTRAKGADTFCPFGPWVTTADEVPDPRRPVAADVGQRRAAPGLEHLRPDLRLPGAGRVHRPDLHARPRRPDPDRDPERRRDGA